MPAKELMKDMEELRDVAEALAREINNPAENVVSRYIRVIHDSATFVNGRKLEHRYSQANVNKEMMNRGVYTTTGIDDLFPHNFDEVAVARDLQDHRFHFIIFNSLFLPLEFEFLKVMSYVFIFYCSTKYSE